jgi:hypothetical protein
MAARSDHFLFGSVFIKKNQTELKKTKPNRNRFKTTGFGSVRFLGQKLVQISLTRIFWFGSVFFRFGSVCFRFGLGSVRFFWFGLGSVRFGFFGFRLRKPKLNQIGWFF